MIINDDIGRKHINAHVAVSWVIIMSTSTRLSKVLDVDLLTYFCPLWFLIRSRRIKG